MRIAADASWAPGGDRSISGVVILVLGAIVHWRSQKQSGAALAVHGAELNSVVTGTTVGIPIRNVTEELREEPTSLELDKDNQATIKTIRHEATSWRSRHSALRAAGIMGPGGQIRHCDVTYYGVSTLWQTLTIVLPKSELSVALNKLQLSSEPVVLTGEESK